MLCNLCDDDTYCLQKTCERDGAKLAEIESKEENDFLKLYLSKLLGDRVLQSGKVSVFIFLLNSRGIVVYFCPFDYTAFVVDGKVGIP